jgi:dTDP-4-amino-4,6-dideoxygalactose transaminase
MKQSVDQLALFGGAPAFREKLHVGRPNIGNRERLLARINDMLDRRWLSNNGPYVQEFEQRIAELSGVRHCVAMCNATIALEIAIRAVGMAGEVIVPSYTFVATAHALQWQQITPVFGDVDPQTHNIDPSRVEALITPRTTGIVATHVWGTPCDVEALAEIAQRRGLRLLYDAAHALGCTHRGRMIGSFGDAEVFSFHATKFFNSFEGGAVVTDDDELARKIRLMKNFGFVNYDQVDYIGTNGKMSEIAAAMGLTSLESIEDFVAVNQRNYQRYRQGLAGLPGLRFMTYDETERRNYQYIVLEIDQARAGISRDQLVKLLWAEQVLARRYFYPGCHQMEPYRSYFPHAGLLLPETEALCQRALQLPTGTAVGEQEIDAVCGIIQFAITHGDAIKQRIGT